MIESIFRALNDNAGAMTAIATVVYAVITLGLLRDSRASRLEANVVASATPWDKSHVYMAVTLENLGPALASNVQFTLDLRLQVGGESEDHRRLAEGHLAPGMHRRFLPAPPTGMKVLKDLAASGYVLEFSWSWQDGRRDWLWRRVTTRRTWTAPLAEVASGYYDGGALVERDSTYHLEMLVAEVKRTRESLVRIERVLGEPARRRQDRELLRLYDESKPDDDDPAS